MKKDFSATASKKTGSGSTPFDQITQVEHQEEARVQQEIDGMEHERTEVDKAVQEKHLKAEEELKEEARGELKTYKENELSTILQKAEKDATKEIEAMDQEYEQRKDEATKKLVSTMTDVHSPLFT